MNRLLNIWHASKYCAALLQFVISAPDNNVNSKEYRSKLTIIHIQGCINLYVDLKVETAGFPG
jgi:hypothetical protein